ncbi:hypothetical protein BD779DRAFT_1673244 [Infundibulicybe gibba]|nr:hypothetical protein BD779DRAFT_1673244 [Infundibulicybe gibba]
MVSLAHITVAQAATGINAAITFIQYTLGLTLVALLLYMIPPLNTAIAWTSITRTLHSSLWPILLRTNSAASQGVSWRGSGFSTFTLFVGILIAVTGIVTPLGLKDGSLSLSPAKLIGASYVPDTSPIGLATSPRSDQYSHTRVCGGVDLILCPGNENNGNASLFEIAPSTVKIFSSTPYGPFGMQFRQYYHLDNYNDSLLGAKFTILESLILRDDIFAVEGLIVDLRAESPGIGFWNHTLPELSNGGEWSQDVLWLEPVTSCVSSNLTIDYTMQSGRVSNYFNLTDRGGFANLAEYPDLSRNGQSGNIYENALTGAIMSNGFTMDILNNLTQDQTQYVGRTFPLNENLTGPSLTPGQMGPIELVYLASPQNISADVDTDVVCSGYGGADEANITNTGVHCGMFAGTPERSDGGDSRLPDDNSTWTQSLYTCASVTRARIQNVTFSFDGQPDLSKLRITRRNTSEPILWATERASINITDVDLLWGSVDDSYGGDPSLSTIRSEVFYVPAGGSDTWGVVGTGAPNTVPAAAWADSYRPVAILIPNGIYNGQGNYALIHKFESIMKNDSINGPARIRNLIWTDIVANNMVGNATSNQLAVAAFQSSISYQLAFAIPAILLFIIWVVAFLGAVSLFASRSLTISHIRDMISHTSVGRVVVGDSRLMLIPGIPLNEDDITPLIRASYYSESPTSSLTVEDDSKADDATRPSLIDLDSQSWAETAGLSPVKLLAARPADSD